MRTSQHTHKMPRVVIVVGPPVKHGFGAGLSSLDIRSAVPTGPGHHDEAWAGRPAIGQPPGHIGQVLWLWKTPRDL